MQACVPQNSTRAIIIYNDALDLASFVCFQQETPGSFSPSEVDFLSTLFTTNNSQHHAPHRQCVNKSTAYSSSLQSCVVHSCLDLRGGDGLEIEIRTVENTAHIAAMSWPNPTRLVSSLLMRTSSHPFNTCIPRPLCLGHFVLSFADQKLINNFSNSNPEILHFCVLKRRAIHEPWFYILASPPAMLFPCANLCGLQGHWSARRVFWLTHHPFALTDACPWGIRGHPWKPKVEHAKQGEFLMLTKGLLVCVVVDGTHGLAWKI